MSEVILSPGVFQIESDQSVYTTAPAALGAAIVGPTVKGRPYVPTYVTTYSQYLSLFGDIFKSGSYYYEYLTSQTAKEYFNNGGKSLLVTRIISGSTNAGTYATSIVPASSSIAGNAPTASFTLEALAWGDTQNNFTQSATTRGALLSGSVYNVRWEVTNVNTGSGTFSLVVRRGDDNDVNKNILETWANMSLDPQLPNYVARVIGDLKPVADLTNNYITFTGSYTNASQYIRVSSVNIPHIDSIDGFGNFKSGSYSGSLPFVTSGSTHNWNSGSFGGGLAATNVEQKMNEAITTTNIQGFAPADYVTAFNLLSNKDEYRYNVLLAPGVSLNNTAAATMIATVEGRGDAIAITDAGVYGTSVTGATTNSSGQSSNYAATYYPWIQLFSTGLGKTVWCPPSTVIGGVLAFNDQVGAEWFAPAGLNRGGIPSVIRAERRLQQTDRDTLYDGNVNPLATFPGSGVAVWGQKTLQRKPTSLDRVNVRRLLIALKDYIGNVSRTLVFEQNTTITRNRFLNQVNPYMDSVVSRQGLYAYKIIMDDTNNTADVVDRNQLVGQIYIQPTKTAEFIVLNFNILPTGATFPA
jgi:phage tail sheath protein FI